jgi:hypothetical protein
MVQIVRMPVVQDVIVIGKNISLGKKSQIFVVYIKGVITVLHVRMLMVKHTVPVEGIIVVDDVNFAIVIPIMFIYIIIQDGKND